MHSVNVLLINDHYVDNEESSSFNFDLSKDGYNTYVLENASIINSF